MGGVLPIVNTIAEFSNDVDLLTLVGSGEIKSGMVQDHVNSRSTRSLFLCRIV